MKKKIIKSIFYFFLALILLYNPITARFLTLIIAPIYELDSEIFYKQIAAESSFRTLALSSKGAVGLGQVKPETAKYISPEFKKIYLWFPLTNLIISAKYTKHLLKKYNDNWSLALASYNWGETNVDKKIRNIKPIKEKNYCYLFSDVPETYTFVNKILQEKK